MSIMYKKGISIILVMLMVLGGLNGVFVGGGTAYAADTVQEWQEVGNAGFSEGYAPYTSLYVDDKGTPNATDDTPYVAYRDNGNGGRATVMEYNGIAWVPVGIAGFSPNDVYDMSLYVDNGTPYVAYSDGDGRATVMKYNDIAWVPVGSIGFSEGMAEKTSLYVYDGTPYVAYVDGDSKATVMKYDGISDWELVGSAGFSAGQAYYTSLYVAADGTPYVAYSDANEEYKATVMKYNNIAWETVGNAGFSAGAADYTSLYVEADIPYVAYRDGGTNNKATVMKYVNSTWVTVGSAGFSEGEADYTSLYVHDGTPYVAYSEELEDDEKATVMKHDGSDWVSAGSAGFSKDNTSYTSLYVAADGTPYVAYSDGWFDGKATVMRLNTVNVSPSLIADTTDNDNLNDIEITFADDETWREEITAVKDGENPLLETDYTISAGMIAINADVLSKGSHTITLKATGYSDATVDQNMLHFYTGEGTGLVSDPYQIATADQLNQVRNLLESGIYFKITADIDLNVSPYKDGAGWLPIGDWLEDGDNPFQGNMDGNGYTITGLTINRPDFESAVGLFGYINNASLSNMKLENVSITGSNELGGLVGYIGNGTVSGSYITGSVSGTQYIGGLIGVISQGTTITNSTATVSVSGTSDVGGLVGYQSNGIVSNSTATGSVSGTSNNVGGLIGRSNSGTVSNSTATGNVSGTSNVGGLVGETSEGTVNKSSATGSVSGTSRVGGLVGGTSLGTINMSSATGNVSGTSRVGGLVGANSQVTITNSYATGIVNGEDKVGGLVGEHLYETISNSYATGSVSGTSSVGGLIGTSSQGTITNSYATGIVIGEGNVGGLVGDLYGDLYGGGTISNSYAAGSVSGSSDVGGLLGLNYENSGTINFSFYDSNTTGQLDTLKGVGKSTADMQTSSTFTDWNLDSAWYLVSEQYPQLWAFTALTPGTDYLTTKLIKVANGMEYSLNDVDYTAITGTSADNIIVNAEDTVHVRVAADTSSAITLTVDITNINTIPPIATAAIAGVTAPVTGANPVATIAATSEYTAAITWSPIAATFAASTAYTATITITPKAGYSLAGVGADFFTVAGATTTNAAGTGVITAVFPATAAAVTPSTPTPTSNKVTSSNGKITVPSGSTGEVSLGDEVTVSIPGDATDKNLNLTIDKVENTQDLVTNNEVLISPVFEILKNFSENFTKPVTLSFVFNLAIVKSNQRVAVFYYDEVKKIWVEVGGGVVSANKISVEVDHFTKFAVMAVDVVEDVPVKDDSTNTTTEINLSDISGHWAETGIKQAVSLGFIKGYVDGTFKPNQTVTRAEFSVMLMNALKPQGAGAELTFVDSAKIGAWARKAVAQAVQAGIINGYEDGTFRPNAEITRSEMAVMIANALKLNIESDTVTGFADDKSIPSWARGAVTTIKKLGLMVGIGANQFNPNAQATRAEAVTVLLNMLELENK